MVSRIMTEDGRIAAEPAFRIGAVFPPETLWQPGLQTFLSHAGQDIIPRTGAVFGPPLVSRYGYYPFKPTQWTKALNAWKDKPVKYRESEAILVGNDDGRSVYLPFLGIYERYDYVLIDLSVDPSWPIDQLMARFWEPLLADAPLFSIAGFGMAPDLGEGASYGNLLAARAKRRYQMAWCMRLATAARTLSPRLVSLQNDRHKTNTRLGIPDIGWKTVLGGDLGNQIDQAALAAIPGVTLRRWPGGLEITIGEEPRWGDVNTAEDVSSYTQVCRVLAPIRGSKAILRSSNLGSNDGATEVIENYYRLWEPG